MESKKVAINGKNTIPASNRTVLKRPTKPKEDHVSVEAMVYDAPTTGLDAEDFCVQADWLMRVIDDEEANLVAIWRRDYIEYYMHARHEVINKRKTVPEDSRMLSILAESPVDAAFSYLKSRTAAFINDRRRRIFRELSKINIECVMGSDVRLVTEEAGMLVVIHTHKALFDNYGVSGNAVITVKTEIPLVIKDNRNIIRSFTNIVIENNDS